MTSSKPKELFELNVVTDDPRFEGFAIEPAPSRLGRESLDDDLTPGFGVAESDPAWVQAKLAKNWVAPTVEGRVAPFNDFPGLDMVLPAFSERACRALSEFLEPNGELLPLHSETQESYFFYNVTTIIDALDHASSVCDFWCDPPTTAHDIQYFAFHTERLAEASIFRLPEWPMGTLVCERFVQRVEDSGLLGFDFLKIWPLDPNVNWRSGEHLRPGVPSLDLKQHTLMILVPLADEYPSSEERETLDRYEDELDELLRVTSVNEPYFGSLEGDETVDGWYRLFLACPDVDALVSHVAPVLARWRWPGIQGVKRYGELYEEDANEEPAVWPGGSF